MEALDQGQLRHDYDRQQKAMLSRDSVWSWHHVHLPGFVQIDVGRPKEGILSRAAKGGGISRTTFNS
jgi:hypothetical protein